MGCLKGELWAAYKSRGEGPRPLNFGMETPDQQFIDGLLQGLTELRLTAVSGHDYSGIHSYSYCHLEHKP